MADISLYELQNLLVENMLADGNSLSSGQVGQPESLRRNVLTQDVNAFLLTRIKPGGTLQDRMSPAALADRLDTLATEDIVGRQSSVNIQSYLRDAAIKLRRQSGVAEGPKREAPPEQQVKARPIAAELRQNIAADVYQGQERVRAEKLAAALEGRETITGSEIATLAQKLDGDGIKAETFVRGRVSEYAQAARTGSSVTPHNPIEELRKYNPSAASASEAAAGRANGAVDRIVTAPVVERPSRTGFGAILGRLGLGRVTTAAGVVIAATTAVSAYSNGASAAEAVEKGVSTNDFGRAGVSALHGDFNSAAREGAGATLTNLAAFGAGAVTFAAGGSTAAVLAVPAVAGFTVSEGIDQFQKGGMTGDEARQRQVELLASIAQDHKPEVLARLQDDRERTKLAREAANSGDRALQIAARDYGILQRISNLDPAPEQQRIQTAAADPSAPQPGRLRPSIGMEPGARG